MLSSGKDALRCSSVYTVRTLFCSGCIFYYSYLFSKLYTYNKGSLYTCQTFFPIFTGFLHHWQKKRNNEPPSVVPFSESHTSLSIVNRNGIGLPCLVHSSSARIPDIRYRWCAHAFSQIKSGMRRLIVGYILPSDAKTVYRIMHQRIDAFVGNCCCGIDPQC